MAKKQSRRSISLSRSTYEAVKKEATRREVTLAGLVESGLAAIGVSIAAHPQQTPALVAASAALRAKSMAARHKKTCPTKLPSLERQLLGDRYADSRGLH